MPHFVIDCSENIIILKSPEEILKEVYDTAESTRLFAKGDIKVRINPFKYFNIGNTKEDFIHIFAYIMEGRKTEQKRDLSIKTTKMKRTSLTLFLIVCCFLFPLGNFSLYAQSPQIDSLILSLPNLEGQEKTQALNDLAYHFRYVDPKPEVQT